jgi:hypothetical protein
VPLRRDDGAMGGDELIAQDEQGWRYTDLYVCLACIGEPALRLAVEGSVEAEQPCSFCDNGSAAPLDVLMDAFVRGVRRQYYRAVDELGWDGRDGGWQGASTVDSWDLVGEFDYCFVGDGVLEAVRDSMNEADWVAVDFARPTADVTLIAGWERFCHQIKYQTRYVIWRKPDREEHTSGGEIPPAQILDAVGQLVDVFPEYLNGEILKETALWRARPHDVGQDVNTSKELGSTPTEKSRTNRMSPAGIPMFYAALDSATAELEAAQGSNKQQLTVGAFYASRDLSVLDLTNLREPPSVFAKDGDDRPQWLFLHAFTASLRAKPALPDIDYVPTQVVTEYFIKIFDNGLRFDGLLYVSDVDGGGNCVVLDVPNERCVELTTGWEEAQEQLAVALDLTSVVVRTLH